MNDQRLEAALNRLEGLRDQPPAEHIAVYEDVHGELQAMLAGAQGGPEETGSDEDGSRPDADVPLTDAPGSTEDAGGPTRDPLDP